MLPLSRLVPKLPDPHAFHPISRHFPRPPSLPIRVVRPYTSPSSAPSPRQVRRNAVLAALLLTSAAGAYYYDTRVRRTETTDLSGREVTTVEKYGKTFTLNLSKRRNAQYTFLRLSDEETEQKLKAHEDSTKVTRRGNPVLKYDTNWVGSNEPCEDRYASDLIPRGDSMKQDHQSWWKLLSLEAEAEGIANEDIFEEKVGKRDLMLFSIFDGHAGWATSELLKKVHHPTIALKLGALQAGYLPSQSGWKVMAGYLNPLTWVGRSNTWTPEYVSQTIVDSFLSLDENICQTPVKMLPLLKVQNSVKDTFPTPRQMFVAMTMPAENGSCAISAIVDAENNGLYLANTGDCRAVAGWESPDGTWKCDVLSEDQMGENPNEVTRMQSEHPNEQDVIKNGRVQGGLQPTRAFGDAIYKWTTNQYNQIKGAFDAEDEKFRKQRPYNFTPPYVTARPEVAYRHLQPESGEKLRFVIMATDGLWDRMTSEEATLLMASYLSHPTHPDIPKTDLPTQFSIQPSTEERPYPAEDLPGTGEQAKGAWVFEGDENAATHLIRNSLGGADRKLRGELLSMHGKITRWMRDDVTCT
ncbi:hypothetical protein TREMEDRAFT_24534 [Tremella mesenterica DSM 1558]|nr:uncharacterized protein TREMEDRAFT_24534 [Tremella mesenterica DSM 1558]EIW73223.1 hypothetical protein TREMEDRAFT_24534 [Tremella mesenterica DSM 1558]